MSNIGVAIWGVGNHAEKRIIPVIKKSKKLDLVGIFSRDIDKIKRIAKKFECNFWKKKEEMLECPNIDVVYISTPTGLHVDCALQVLEYNKNVWCEKPLTQCLKEVKFLINLAEKKSLSISESFMYLYHPQYLKIREYIRDNLKKRLSILCRFGIPFLEKPGFRHNKKLGGGAFLDVGCYPISLIADIFENERILINYSEIFQDKKLHVDIYGKAILYIKDSKNITLEWGYGKSYRNEIDVWGENDGMFSEKIFSKPDNFSPCIIKLNKEGLKKKISLTEDNQFILMFNQFIKNIKFKNFAKIEHKNIIKRIKLIEKIEKTAHKVII